MKVLTVLTVLLAFFSSSGQCCGPAEIGQRFIITSTANVQVWDRVRWKFIYSNENILFDSSLTNQNSYPNEYVGTRTSVTILNVTRNNEKVFLHVVNSSVVYSCSLIYSIYKRASIPTCTHLTLREENLISMCTTAEVFPRAKCQFSLQNGGIDGMAIRDGTYGSKYIRYNHTNPQSGKNEYYSTSCTLLYPVNGLKPGNWTVHVNMYPYLTGVSLAQGTMGRAGNTLQLSVPTVNIDRRTCPKGLAGESDTNVRDGYIRQGERASCLCTRAQSGNPPGKVTWSSKQGGNFEILSQSEDEATIRINSSGTYTCQSTTVLNGPAHSMTYQPKYAYGPSSTSLTFQHPGPIYLCPNQQTNIDITCQVPANSFNPAILFTIRDGGATNIVDKVAGDTAESKSVNYNFTKSGQHIFTCLVENEVFYDMYNETMGISVRVYEPPTDPPKISARSIQHGDILVVGDDVTVTCDVLGGYPSVQSVTLTCGQNQSMTHNWTSSVLTLKEIGLSYNGTNCTCQATHVTGCYDLMGILLLTFAISNPTQSELVQDSIPTGAVVGGAVVGLLAIAVVVVGIFFWIRRGRNKKAESSDERVYDNPTHDFTEVDNSDLYSPYEPSSSVTAKYDDHQPTMTSATDLTEKYNPEPRLNLYDEIDTEDLNRDLKLFATKPEAKTMIGAKPNRPQVLKPNVKIKAKPKSPETDTKDNVTTEATEGPPLQSANVYEEMELEDQSKGPLAISEETGPAQHSPDDNDEVYLNCQAKNETDSLASNDVIAEGTKGPAQHSPNDENQIIKTYE